MDLDLLGVSLFAGNKCGHHFFSVMAELSFNGLAGPVYGQFLIFPPELLHWPYQMQWPFAEEGVVSGNVVTLPVTSEVETSWPRVTCNQAQQYFKFQISQTLDASI